MLGRTTGAVLVGVDARLIDVEVDLGGGLPAIAAVGLPDSAVREGLDRIRSALRHAGFSLPQHRIVVNLAPAEVRKQGAALDLPIAVALLVADGKIEPLDPRATVLAGELALDGCVRPVRGALSVALAARAAGHRRVLVPGANADEASLVGGLEVVPLGHLADVVAYAKGHRPRYTGRTAAALLREAPPVGGPDLADVRGQAFARRALEIAAAGGHHLLLSGPPGSGKTMLARRLPGILPGLSVEESLEVTRVWSAAGHERGLITERPFRAPHHSISFAGMTGGGPRLRPGEISLATHGVLYLDELTEFRRDALEALRQPIEEGSIAVSRVHGAVVLPARFGLVASMNPCPCGYHGSADGRCSCTPRQIGRYRGRLSGPLLDRFDLVVDVPPVDLAAAFRSHDAEPSAVVRARVEDARERQRARFGAGGPATNARMRVAELVRFAALRGGARRLLLDAATRLGLSARGFDRVRRVSRTIADLEGDGEVHERHVAEAVQLRHALGA